MFQALGISKVAQGIAITGPCTDVGNRHLTSGPRDTAFGHSTQSYPVQPGLRILNSIETVRTAGYPCLL